MNEAFSPEDVAKRSLAVKRELDSAARSKAAKVMLDRAAAAKKARLQEDFAPLSDTITLVANEQYADATGIVHDVLGGRVLAALEDHKQMIAQSLFVPSADSLNEN